MCQPTPIALAVAAMLGLAAFPAAAVRIIDINNTTNAVYVSSNTQAWDAYATSCVNATQTPGLVDQGAGCGTPSAAKPTSDEALFFWGGADMATNSTVELAWTPDTASAEVQAVRLLTPKDDAGNFLQTYGPDQQPIFEAPGFSIPPSLGWPDSTYQRGGIASTWGRDALPDPSDRTSGFLGSKGFEMDVGVTIGSGSQIDNGQLTSELPTNADNFFWPGIGAPARSFDTTLPVNSTSVGQRDSLEKGETVELSFYDAGTSANTAYPTAYMGDTLVQLKTGSTFQASDPAEAGLMLLETPEDAVVTYERSGDDLTATVNIRAGGDGIQNATYRVFNQGGANSTLDGTYSSTTVVGSGTTVTGDTADSIDLGLAEVTNERTVNAQSQTLLQTETTGKQTATISQGISGGAAGEHNQEIIINSVGPILNLGDADTPSYTYGTGVVDLGYVDLDDADRELTISNVVETDFGPLTDLLVDEVATVTGDNTQFALSGLTTPTTLGASPTGDEETLTVTMQARGDFSTTLRFTTDQNAAANSNGANIEFGLTGAGVLDAVGTGADNNTTFGNVRAGSGATTTDDAGAAVQLVIENTGDEGSTLDGQFAAPSGDTGSFEPTDASLPFSLTRPTDGSGNPTQTRAFTFTPGNLGLTETNGREASIDQTVTSDRPDFTEAVSAKIVGPVLGVNYRGEDLPYDESVKIDLGSVDITTDNTSIEDLIISNLFSVEGLGSLTSLSLLNVGIDGDDDNYYCILAADDGCGGEGLFAGKVILANGRETAGTNLDLPDMRIQFAPTAFTGGDYQATLWFETDMNAAFGAAGDRIEFLLTGRGVVPAQAPLPGTLALLGAGLFGMAGLRRRRMLRRGH